MNDQTTNVFLCIKDICIAKNAIVCTLHGMDVDIPLICMATKKPYSSDFAKRFCELARAIKKKTPVVSVFLCNGSFIFYHAFLQKPNIPAPDMGILKWIAHQCQINYYSAEFLTHKFKYREYVVEDFAISYPYVFSRARDITNSRDANGSLVNIISKLDLTEIDTDHFSYSKSSEQIKDGTAIFLSDIICVMLTDSWYLSLSGDVFYYCSCFLEKRPACRYKRLEPFI